MKNISELSMKVVSKPLLVSLRCNFKEASGYSKRTDRFSYEN